MDFDAGSQSRTAQKGTKLPRFEKKNIQPPKTIDYGMLPGGSGGLKDITKPVLQKVRTVAKRSNRS